MLLSRDSCVQLCDPIDGSPPGSPIPGSLQARLLEWVAISFSNAWKWKVKVKSLSCVLLLATSWTAAYQAPPSMGFSRQEYWSGVPLPSTTKLLCSGFCMVVQLSHPYMTTGKIIALRIWTFVGKAMPLLSRLLNCGIGEDSWESFGLQTNPTSPC